MSHTDVQPITIYGSNISYFTGKLENYFRMKGVPYDFHALRAPRDEIMIRKKVGVYQVPALTLGDGRWMTDSTKIIQWFETEYPQYSLLPRDPLQVFVCLLIEDYADEWLWRPAMHYRWYYPEGAYHSSRHLADEHLASLPLPGSLKRWVLRYRQRSRFTTGDGVTKANVAGVEQIYLRSLQQLQAIFERRPFILGDRPSLADIGLSGPFFRHFGLDPIPQEIMRQQAPAVFEWVARLWNTRMEDCKGAWVAGVPDDIGPLLDEIGSNYLPYLCANVQAVEDNNKRFDVEIGGVEYRRARYSRYRVWCLQELRSHYDALPADAQIRVRELLDKHSCWEPLWRNQSLPLLPGQEQDLPFKASTRMVAVNE
ncbi:MAG: glutathione S-transferase family protein [Pseudomonadales bacterium]